MLNSVRKWRKAFFVLLLVCVSARLFTGAAEAQVNFMTLLNTQSQSKSLSVEATSASLAVQGQVLLDPREASSIPAKHTEYKLYKKYISPDRAFHIEEVFVYKVQKLLVSIQATSYYIKDLTLRSLHSNSPPAPVTTLLLTVFMYLFISRIGVFGNYGESKNISDRRFGLQ